MVSAAAVVKICAELGIKPWRALRALGLSAGDSVALPAFVSWWFWTLADRARQREAERSASALFARYDADADGLLNCAEMLELCADPQVQRLLEPWQVFQQLDVDGQRPLGRLVLPSRWFRAEASFGCVRVKRACGPCPQEPHLGKLPAAPSLRDFFLCVMPNCHP